ncbi:hypothetical protein, partial [Mycoplasmopsis meleagridis]|uniref:hypothetical protein n=1 Tax=Mycoplasmopsis meleagridis TaxID=29561 RepID=UPI00073D33C1
PKKKFKLFAWRKKAENLDEELEENDEQISFTTKEIHYQDNLEKYDSEKNEEVKPKKWFSFLSRKNKDV